jgi:DNA-binding FadR family transcriptional regulator
MEPLFRAAKQNRIFQDVVDQIQDAIIDGQLKTGDRLPAERQLQKMMKTSRSTLREALRVLEQKGLIEIKLGMGGGAVVRTVSTEQVTESLDLLIRSRRVSLNHLAEFREGAEGDVVALATKRAKRTDIDRLQALLERAHACTDRRKFLEADRDLHLAVVGITRNPIYISILKTVHENIHRYFDRFLPMNEKEMAENYRDLENIVGAMAGRDAERARDLARNHIRRFNGYMKAKRNADRQMTPATETEDGDSGTQQS